VQDFNRLLYFENSAFGVIASWSGRVGSLDTGHLWSVNRNTRKVFKRKVVRLWTAAMRSAYIFHIVHILAWTEVCGLLSVSSFIVFRNYYFLIKTLSPANLIRHSRNPSTWCSL